MFARMYFDLSDSVSVYAKGLFNNRESTNRAAPEPIFVGPGAGTGGLADTISISALNPYNPFGIDLDADSNLAGSHAPSRRSRPAPVHAGRRHLVRESRCSRALSAASSRYHWDVNVGVRRRTTPSQVFTNGYNVAKIGLALGDPAVCAQVPGCVPLDLFGGQDRPFTQEMIDYIRTTQIDSSKQILTLFSANLTGDLFDIGDRAAGFAVGAEHRKYEGDFLPDPLRQNGESQDSFAAPVSAELRRQRAVRRVQLPAARVAGSRVRPCAGLTTPPSAARPPARWACAGSPSRRWRSAARTRRASARRTSASCLASRSSPRR